MEVNLKTYMSEGYCTRPLMAAMAEPSKAGRPVTIKYSVHPTDLWHIGQHIMFLFGIANSSLADSNLSVVVD